MRSALLIAALLLLIPCQAYACFQTPVPPYKFGDTEIRGRLTYDYRPIVRASLELSTADKVVARTKSDRDGHFVFRNLQPGEYRVVMIEPSSETIPIILSPTEKPGVFVANFYGDFCQEVSILPGFEYGLSGLLKMKML